MILPSVFDAHNTVNVLDHANGRTVALRIGANVANFGVGYVVANFAVFYGSFFPMVNGLPSSLE